MGNAIWHWQAVLQLEFPSKVAIYLKKGIFFRQMGTVEPSMLKLKGSELVQDQDELLFRVIDHLALPEDTSASQREAVNEFAEYVASGRYHHRGYTIAGGSSEVQHNIIAKQVLGL